MLGNGSSELDAGCSLIRKKLCWFVEGEVNIGEYLRDKVKVNIHLFSRIFLTDGE